MSGLIKMPMGMMQNEINLVLRDASTLAMKEASKRKQEAAAVTEAHTVSNDGIPSITCATHTLADGTLILACSLLLSIIVK